MLDLDDEALGAFLEESREHLETIERELLALEGSGLTADTINAIFRAAHSIKGTAGFFSLDSVKNLAHEMESVFGRMRAGQLSVNQEIVSVLLEANSHLSEMIGNVREADRVDASSVLARLQELASGETLTFGVNGLPVTPEPPRRGGSTAIEVRRSDGSVAFFIDAERLAEAQRSGLGGRFVYWITAPEGAVAKLEKVSVVLERRPRDATHVEVTCTAMLERARLADAIGVAQDQVVLSRDVLMASDVPLSAPTVVALPNLPLQVASVSIPAASASIPLRPAVPRFSMGPGASGDAPGATMRPSEGVGTIRVNVTQLDRLMALAGELVLTRNALLKKASERDLDEMIELSQRVDAITSELQDGIMATRMQPVGIVFTRFRRIVRDLARNLNKHLELEIEGEEVELDKTIIEAIGDPLTHLVRNAADHGIEDPATRVAAGKRERGSLRLRAFHEAGQVVIEVSDDGRGIDPARVGNKAVEAGLLTRDQLESMPEEEVIRLIFEPGFSTAAKVTDVSGRGVGMDVVQSCIARVGGTIDVRSSVGAGSTITVRLPLTLAIIPSILVATGGERFALPQVNVFELLRITASEVKRRIERVGKANVLRLRGELLPLVRLSDVLGLESPEYGSQRSINLVVVAAGGLRFGLVVDQLLDSEEIVVKPLGAHLTSAREYAGATILGDGAVALILDVAGIAATTNLASNKSMIDALAAREAANDKVDRHAYLIVENAPGEAFAVPLSLVARIERFAERTITSMAGRRSITHGTSILALMAIEDAANVTRRPSSNNVHAVVCRVFGREVGFLASRILDVVESDAPVDGVTHVQPGIMGSTIIDDRVVLLVDVHGLVSKLLPELRAAPVDTSARPTVLVVEDSPFFRKQLVACLQEGGYRTLAAEDGRQGLDTLTANAKDVQLVITDVEMPRMDGIEMTRKIREQSRFGALPIFAVTTLSSENDQRRGREAGLNEWLIKFDRELILDRARFHIEKSGGRALQQGAFG